MSKSKRKRRLKEEDFKKKKLKVGKKLPMPDNVTRTSFKARSINIAQQNLQQDGGIETNLKGKKLKDLLRSCSHYNTQARVDALLGLKDLAERHPHVFKDNLNEVLRSTLGLITDLEYSVRKTFLTIFVTLFRTLSETELSPFFGSIIAYLCSAMTHLNDGVRLDSMKFLDLCLQYFPQLVRANAKNIIVDFMNMISSEKSSASKSVGIPRTATLKAKVTSQKTQLELLSRLNRLLHVVFPDAQESSRGEGNRTFPGKNLAVPENVGVDDDKILNRTVGIGDSNSPGYNRIGCHNSTVVTVTSSNHDDGNAFDSVSLSMFPILVSNFSLKSSPGDISESDTMGNADTLTSETWLADFISCLTPVLFEYWVECCPAQFSTNLAPVKEESLSLQIMKETLEIFVTLVQSLEKTVLEQSQLQEFLKSKLYSQFDNHFVKVFPLSFTVRKSGKRTKKDESVESITDVDLNILIARLLSYFIPELKHLDDTDNFPRWASEVLKYLQKVLVGKTTNGGPLFANADIKSVMKLVKMFLLGLPKAFESLKVQLLESVFQLFECSRATSNVKKVLLDVLADLLDPARDLNQELKSILDERLKSLLKILKKDVSEDVKYKIFLVCKSGILQGFPNLMSAIADLLPSIFKVENFSNLSEIVQQLVIEILYHTVKIPSCELFEVLAKLCMSRSLSLKFLKYLLLVVHQLVHSNAESSVVLTIADYLSFVLSVVLGQTKDQLEHIQTLKNHPNVFCHEVSKLNTLVFDFGSDGESSSTKENWEYTNFIEIICQFLAQSDYSGKFLEMLGDPLCRLFEKFPMLPLEAVYRLLYLVKPFYIWQRKDMVLIIVMRMNYGISLSTGVC